MCAFYYSIHNMNYRQMRAYALYGIQPGLRSETSPDHARVSFYLHCSLDVNKDRMTP